MKKIIKLAIFLGVICVLASGALYYTNNITAPIIAENKKVATEKLLKEIDSKADKFETKEINDGSIATVYYAYEKNQLKMSIYEVSTYGFQSQVTVLVAIDNSTDKFVGFKVIDQAETPGYGTQITANNAYTKQFSSKTIKDKIDVISGSSVTTSALNKAILEAVTYYQANK